jgi:thymidylate synthase (FAD)
MVNEDSFYGYNPTIRVIQLTPEPQKVVALAANMTMYKNPTEKAKDYGLLCSRLLSMNHTSLFEHVVFTFKISDVTRSFLAQITRHRMGSFTSGSQHYQHYADYGFCIAEKWRNNIFVLQAVDEAMTNYKMLRKAGCPKEEARQVLPGGMKVNILWTVNARSLINFLNLRMCHRNVEEMRRFADLIWVSVNDIFPELFSLVGPDCKMTECKQGKMKCKRQ